MTAQTIVAMGPWRVLNKMESFGGFHGDFCLSGKNLVAPVTNIGEAKSHWMHLLRCPYWNALWIVFF